jgi:hypothetical protein
MFVGPHALEFQTRLIDRLLVPLRFNNAVIQCERTDWESLPGIATRSTMSKQDLKTLFDTYRSRGIEPVPLIQSLGHMEWMFANGKNLDLAVNPDVAYTLDARRTEARAAIANVWEEAIALLQPRAVHFGLDEIDSRGFPSDPTLASRLWQLQVPPLMELAKKHGATPMLWGDMLLSPGDANDGMHAPDRAEADRRLAAVTKGAFVTDWHYANEPDPKRYKSLAHFARKGFKPIASGWYRPQNIYGLTRAAIANNAGYLQTTWAGHEGSESSAVREFDQIAAYVLAADYAWGAQTLTPDKLPYDPVEVARRMLFDTKQPTRPLDGLALLASGGTQYRIGQFQFRGENALVLRSVVSERALKSATSYVVNVNRPARRIAAAVDCFAWMEFGTPVATIIVRTADGRAKELQLRYGIEVRAYDDPNFTAAPRQKGRTAVVVEVADESTIVKTVEFHRSDASAGLRVHGITLI